jgi:hypothetical protein
VLHQSLNGGASRALLGAALAGLCDSLLIITGALSDPAFMYILES